MLQSHKELIVWQKSMLLVKEIFLLTKRFPQSEQYGLVSQMRRSAVSIPSNIAEGYGRGSKKEYGHFISIAYGSGLELETQFIISKDLTLAKTEDFSKIEPLLEEVLKMLYALNSKLSSRP